jgi:hypothetical protein
LELIDLILSKIDIERLPAEKRKEVSEQKGQLSGMVSQARDWLAVEKEVVDGWLQSARSLQQFYMEN